MAIFAGQRSGSCMEERLRPIAFELHQTNEAWVVSPLAQLVYRVLEPLQVLSRQIDSAFFQVATNIADDICHLQGQSKLNRILFAGGIPITKNFDAHQSDRTGNVI